MGRGTKVEVLKSWDEEHIEHLEETVEELRDKVASLTQELSLKPKALNYKEQYEKVLKKLHDCWNETIPF